MVLKVTKAWQFEKPGLNPIDSASWNALKLGMDPIKEMTVSVSGKKESECELKIVYQVFFFSFNEEFH